jgi:predicted neutral ceramidase superfamily lipid hydrolase
LFLSVPVIISLLVGIFYGFSKLISSRPVDIIFELMIIAIPPAIFSSAYFIFSKRTKTHPSALVRGISQSLFAIGICSSAVVLALSLITYFAKGYNGVTDYKSYSLAFVAGNIAALFIIAIMQAFTTKKEEDWLEKRKRTGQDL